MDAEQGEIGADHLHHRGDRTLAEQAEPFAFGSILVGGAEFLREPLAYRLEIIAGIQPFGNRTDIVAQRLAVAQMRRPGEDIDLPPGIVDVIFAHDPVARPFEQAAQRIADDCTAAMAHMHRAGRIGGDIFDIDRPPVAQRRAAIVVALGGDRQQFAAPRIGRQAQIDKARTGDFGGVDVGFTLQMLDDLLRQRARIGLGLLGQHHRGIGRQIAVRGIARRFHGHICARRIRGQHALHFESVENGIDPGRKSRVKCLHVSHAARLAYRRKMARHERC